jgi:hypothetical protein
MSIKTELINELSSNPVNILRVRTLCRNNPGLIAVSELRLRVWRLLLLGTQFTKNGYDDQNVSTPTTSCEEQHVLEADVHRTRADIEDFRSFAWRKAIGNILQHFCLTHNCQYKQGMNEILAPFVFLSPPPKGDLLPFTLFEAFLFRYLERFFAIDNSLFLFKAFRLFHLLLLYHDPNLANHLFEQEFPPELYAPQWFLTLYSRALPLPHVLRLWDMIIAVDDPSFTFFIGLALLRRKRNELLLAETFKIPEIITTMNLQDEEDIDRVVSEALVLYNLTPRSFCRNLRLCCVASSELTPLPKARLSLTSSCTKIPPILTVKDHALSIQSVRSCLMLSVQELLEQLNLDSSSIEQKVSQTVIIDIRSFEECSTSGAGVLPRAIQIEPDFLETPDALEIWLQHFDTTKGCNIVIIDLPPIHATSKALWRRLLLGEGDGYNGTSSVYDNNNNNNINNFSKETKIRRDLDSPFASAESATISNDLLRPAIRLAKELQKVSFPNVSVIEGIYFILLL